MGSTWTSWRRRHLHWPLSFISGGIVFWVRRPCGGAQSKEGTFHRMTTNTFRIARKNGGMKPSSGNRETHCDTGISKTLEIHGIL